MAQTSISGPVLVAASDVFGNSAVQEHDLGALGVASDGRMFRYCKAGGTGLVPGKLQQGPAIVANHQNIAVAAAAAAGSTSVTVTLGATAATENQYAEGLLVINDATGEGYTYRIKGHPAADASAALVITLDDPILVALTTSSEACLIANVYNGVIIHPTTPTNAAAGVPLKAITASYFGWLQTHGAVAGLNADAALTVGSAISPSNATAGGFENGVIAQGFVGQALQTGVDTEYRTIFLNID